MKKFLYYTVYFAITFSLLFILTACSSETQNDDLGGTSDDYETSGDYEAPEDYEVSDEQDPVVLQEDVRLPGEYPMSFLFLSGAGGWSTDLVLEDDVTFHGVFHDSDMGDMYEKEYPNGTCYICNFNGIFDDITQVNDYTWAMKLADIGQDEIMDEAWIEDGIRYVGSYPYGLEDGKEFTFYTPETPLSALSEECLSWYPYRGLHESKTLDCYCIRNNAMDECFFSELTDQ